MKKLMIIAFLAISNVICVAQESVLLRYKMKKGEKYELTMSMKQDMGATGGMNMKFKFNSSIGEVNKGSYVSETKVKTLSMDMLQGGNVMSYDSTKSDDELDMMGKQMKAQFAPFFKATIYTTTSSRGKVTSTEIKPDTPALNQFKDQNNSIEYPEEKVKVGSSWSDENNNQGMKMKTVYTVSKITKDKVLIDVTGDVSGLGTGKIIGKVVVDRASGIPSSSEINVNVNAGGAEVKISTKATMKKV